MFVATKAALAACLRLGRAALFLTRASSFLRHNLAHSRRTVASPSATHAAQRAPRMRAATKPSSRGTKGCDGAQVQMEAAERCGVSMSGDGTLTPQLDTSGSVASSSSGLF